MLRCFVPMKTRESSVFFRSRPETLRSMLYRPEFHREMFAWKVADMKNSVSDRMNAQSSCVGHLDESH